MNALFDVLPALRERVAWLSLGCLPTPVEDASAVLRARGGDGELWLKRDDASSPVYGGNKLRLLEHLLAQAKQAGAVWVYATGATGSNFALATALHAPRVGLKAGVICFPQPMTPDGERNQLALKGRARLVEIPHWSLLPLAAERVRSRSGHTEEPAFVLSQVRVGAAGLLGYLAAGLELAQQVARGECPEPARIVLPIGSAATAGGILAGLWLARQLGLGFKRLPRLETVRVAAWPLSRRARVLALAESALDHVATLLGEPSLRPERADLPEVEVVVNQLGAGYPWATPAATQARLLFAQAGWPVLDETYSGKAAAHLLASFDAKPAPGPVLFWSTKSSAPLPAALEPTPSTEL